MRDLIESRIARHGRLMEAYWAPTLRYLDEINAGQIPTAGNMTLDFASGYHALFCALRYQHKDAPGAEAMKEVLGKIHEQNPALAQQIDDRFIKIMKTWRRYDMQNTYWTGFTDLGQGRLRIAFHLVSSKIDFDEKKTSVIAVERFSEDREFPVTVFDGPKQKHHYMFAEIEGGKTPSPYVLDVILEPGNHTVYVQWGNGRALERLFVFPAKGIAPLYAGTHSPLHHSGNIIPHHYFTDFT